MPKKKTHEEFLQQYSNLNIEIVGKYTNDSTDIECKCNKNNLHPHFYATPSNLLRGTGCPYCSGRKALLGHTDLWTTHPSMAKLLLHEDDGYKFTYASSKKVDWICKNCGNIIHQKIISNVIKRGLSCNKCSDGFNYPNKLMMNILSQLNIEIFPEKTFDWSNSKRYDFYLPKLNCIIEMHGLQHYKYCGIHKKSGESLKDTQTNDTYKMNIAYENNIKNYIAIDARKSELEFIKENVLSSNLGNLIDLNNINWKLCESMTGESKIKEVLDLWNSTTYISPKEISKLLHISHITVLRYLKILANDGVVNYNSYSQKQNCCKKVKCVDTNEVFSSIREASKTYDISESSIGQCCNTRLKTAGKLHWVFI